MFLFVSVVSLQIPIERRCRRHRERGSRDIFHPNSFIVITPFFYIDNRQSYYVITIQDS